MRTRLPAAAKQPEDLRFRRSQVLGADSAQGRDPHFLDHTIRKDCNRFDSLDVEKYHQAAIPVPGRDRKNTPPLHTCGKRMTGHVRSNSEGPHAGSRTSSLLRLESIAKPRILLRFHVQIDLAS